MFLSLSFHICWHQKWASKVEWNTAWKWSQKTWAQLSAIHLCELTEVTCLLWVSFSTSIKWEQHVCVPHRAIVRSKTECKCKTFENISFIWLWLVNIYFQNWLLDTIIHNTDQSAQAKPAQGLLSSWWDASRTAFRRSLCDMKRMASRVGGPLVLGLGALETAFAHKPSHQMAGKG